LCCLLFAWQRLVKIKIQARQARQATNLGGAKLDAV
jgi:hypothetical protein